MSTAGGVVGSAREKRAVLRRIVHGEDHGRLTWAATCPPCRDR
eukprot:CAMPEP_0119506748 /NCGR_PEP_ID=MMETSP1344-20130328/26867_1 /TAXON_ID=236787 /ORGANISM="Florenciella parvula, Strain CCMP2471" /LENGTH=42 /DNA_ID= /DNA_START= /DNA_END= /DNA_ORIENTATION=